MLSTMISYIDEIKIPTKKARTNNSIFFFACRFLFKQELRRKKKTKLLMAKGFFCRCLFGALIVHWRFRLGHNLFGFFDVISFCVFFCFWFGIFKVQRLLKKKKKSKQQKKNKMIFDEIQQ